MESWDGKTVEQQIFDQLEPCPQTKAFLPTTVLINYNITGLFLRLDHEDPYGANYCLLDLPLTKRKESCNNAEELSYY